MAIRDDIRFYLDPESGLAHCFTAHGIHERQVIEVLRHPGDRFRGRDGTFVAEGQTAAGRYLRIIYREYRSAGYVFVITAYDMSESAKQAYRRRHKRR
jgi:hypothetical protein